MKVIKCDLSRELKSVELHILADLHIGDPHCDLDLIKERIKTISETPNAYAMLNGDIINNSTKTSVGDVYSEALTPMEQLNLAIELLEPIKNKIIAVTNGNHEFRTWKMDGVDLMRLACQQLGIEDKYSTTSCLMFLRFGEVSDGHKESKGTGKLRMVSYVIYMNHGSGGGRKEGAKAIRLADMSSIVDADIYIHSHTHLPMVMKEAFYRTDVRNSSYALVDKLFVNTSACLKYGGYGETYEFKPSSTDTPIVLLSGTRKKFKAKL